MKFVSFWIRMPLSQVDRKINLESRREGTNQESSNGPMFDDSCLRICPCSLSPELKGLCFFMQMPKSTKPICKLILAGASSSIQPDVYISFHSIAADATIQRSDWTSIKCGIVTALISIACLPLPNKPRWIRPTPALFWGIHWAGYKNTRWQRAPWGSIYLVLLYWHHPITAWSKV